MFEQSGTQTEASMLHPVSNMRVLREGRRPIGTFPFTIVHGFGAPRYNSTDFQTMHISCNRENDRFDFGTRVSVRIYIMLRESSAPQNTFERTWPVPRHVSTAGLAHADIAIWSEAHTCERNGLRLHDSIKLWSRHDTETAS